MVHSQHRRAKNRRNQTLNGAMCVIDLPNDVLNVVLSYLFVDTLLEEEEYQKSVASARRQTEIENFDAHPMEYMNMHNRNVHYAPYEKDMYSLCYLNRCMALYMSDTRIGKCFFRHTTRFVRTNRIYKKRRSVINFFKKYLLGGKKHTKILCTVDRNCIGIKTTTPLFVQFTVKRVECEKENTVNKRNLRNNGPLDLEYEFDGYTHRIIGVESTLTTLGGKKVSIPAKYFSEFSTVNFEPIVHENKLAVSVNVDTPDFDSPDLRFNLFQPCHPFENKAWGIA